MQKLPSLSDIQVEGIVVPVASACGCPADCRCVRPSMHQYCSAAAAGNLYLTLTLTRMLLIFYHWYLLELYRPIYSEIEVSGNRIYSRCNKAVDFVIS